jgi:hypothetical protein
VISQVLEGYAAEGIPHVEGSIGVDDVADRISAGISAL